MTARELFRALLRRELGVAHWLLLVAMGAAAWAAAVVAAEVRAGDLLLPLFGGFATRFHLTGLAVAALLVVLRIATRAAEDHGAGWLDPYVTAGGSRTDYALALAMSAAAAALLMFVAAAVPFAVAVLVVDGSAELLHGLPVLLAGGMLLLAAYAALTMLWALLLRSALATIAVVAGFAAAPLIVVTLLLLTDEGLVMNRITALLLNATPPLQPPARAAGFASVALFTAAAAGLTVPVARRYVGRRP